MSKLQETVRKIYEEAGKSGDVMAFGPQNEGLPPEWEAFFKRSAQGLRKQQEQPQPEPKPEKEPDLLPEILTRIVKRIEEIEARLDVIEALSQIQERIEDESEPVRKGEAEIEEGLEVAGQKSWLAGASGEFVTRREA